MSLGNTPCKEVSIFVEACKSYVFSIHVITQSGLEVDLTDAEMRFVATAGPYRNETVVLEITGIPVPDRLNGRQFQFQASDLALPPGEYAYDVTLVTDGEYSIPLMNGPMEIGPNADGDISNTYYDVLANQDVIVELNGTDLVEISVPDYPDSSSALLDGSVTSVKIANGTILDEDISPSAGIARSKIAGLFDIDVLPNLSPDVQGQAVSLASDWTVNGATVASGSVSDPDSPAGNTSISMTTLTDGTMAKAARYGAPALDTTSGQFAMLVKVSDVANLQSIQLYTGGGGFAWYTLLNAAFGGTPPYTTVRSNEWCWITFGRRGQDTSGTVAMPNTTDWQIAVNPVNGQQVTVKVAAIRVLSRVAAFPNGVISLVFDDGLDSAWTHARPVLQERGVAATAAVIADAIGESSFMTEAQLESLYSLGRWEISGHQYTLNRDDITALTDSELRAEFVALKTWLRSKGWSRGIDMYVYPQGRHDARTAGIVREFFKYGRVTYSSPGGLPRIADPTNGQAYVVDASTTVGDLQTDMAAARANGEWRIYVFHDIVTSGATGGEVTQGTLAALIDYAISTNIPVLPMGEVLNTVENNTNALDIWSSWTPTITGWTQGNGTFSNCRWTRIGDIVYATATFTLGSTTTVAHPLGISLPVGGVIGPACPQPHAYLLDVGSNSYYGACRTDGSIIQVGGPPTAGGAGTALTSTFPFTWAAGDIVYVNVTYRAV